MHLKLLQLPSTCLSTVQVTLKEKIAAMNDEDFKQVFTFMGIDNTTALFIIENILSAFITTPTEEADQLHQQQLVSPPHDMPTASNNLSPIDFNGVLPNNTDEALNHFNSLSPFTVSSFLVFLICTTIYIQAYTHFLLSSTRAYTGATR